MGWTRGYTSFPSLSARSESLPPPHSRLHFRQVPSPLVLVIHQNSLISQMLKKLVPYPLTPPPPHSAVVLREVCTHQAPLGWCTSVARGTGPLMGALHPLPCQVCGPWVQEAPVPPWGSSVHVQGRRLFSSCSGSPWRFPVPALVGDLMDRLLPGLTGRRAAASTLRRSSPGPGRWVQVALCGPSLLPLTWQLQPTPTPNLSRQQTGIMFGSWAFPRSRDPVLYSEQPQVCLPWLPCTGPQPSPVGASLVLEAR